jgi:acetyl-CoA carboxylase / biotin carboxylase 1
MTTCSLLHVAFCIPQVVAIANDITYNSGSFGPREDAVFRAMTEYALQQKLPLIYLAANSGARVGLASEIKACLQVGQPPVCGKPAD